jgi:hypothetical protein
VSAARRLDAHLLGRREMPSIRIGGGADASRKARAFATWQSFRHRASADGRIPPHAAVMDARSER